MSVAQFAILEFNSQPEDQLEFRKKTELCENFKVCIGLDLSLPASKENPRSSGLIRQGTLILTEKRA